MLARSGDACECLVDVNMLDIIVILVVPNVESYGGQGNSASCKPAYTLQT